MPQQTQRLSASEASGVTRRRATIRCCCIGLLLTEVHALPSTYSVAFCAVKTHPTAANPTRGRWRGLFQLFRHADQPVVSDGPVHFEDAIGDGEQIRLIDKQVHALPLIVSWQ